MISYFRNLRNDWHHSSGIGWFLLKPSVRWFVSWVIVLTMAGILLDNAWHDSDKTPAYRTDGNSGHAEIDFGGQWLMGRMVLEGHAEELYVRSHQRRILEENYPREASGPEDKENDVIRLMRWTANAERDDEEKTKIGGGLYPPVHAFYYAPLALLPPQASYRTLQVINVLLLFVSGWFLTKLRGATMWWPVLVMFIIVFPGIGGTVNLGQNTAISLVILCAGWLALDREHDLLAGMIWALLAFKPVWAVTFCLVPLWMRRWRMLFAMMGTGALLALLTVPVVGIQSWRDWLTIGSEASSDYNFDRNWVDLSRDLLGLARRWTIDFTLDYDTRGELYGEGLTDANLLPTLLGWAFLVFVLEVTTRRAWSRAGAPKELLGAKPAFVLLGAWLACYHFMYYDVLMAVFPVSLLLLRPRDWWGRWALVAVIVLTLVTSHWEWYNEVYEGSPLLFLNTWDWYADHYIDPQRRMIPFEQFGMILIWLICAWHREPKTKPLPDPHG